MPTSKPSVDSYAALYRDFRWHVPQHFNIADMCCGRWARHTPDAIAIRFEHEDGTQATLSYGELQRRANRLSHALARLGDIAAGKPKDHLIVVNLSGRGDKDLDSVARHLGGNW